MLYTFEHSTYVYAGLHIVRASNIIWTARTSSLLMHQVPSESPERCTCRLTNSASVLNNCTSRMRLGVHGRPSFDLLTMDTAGWGRAGTAVPQGAVSELPNLPFLSFPITARATFVLESKPADLRPSRRSPFGDACGVRRRGSSSSAESQSSGPH